ncbi:hypothetical protein T484DRAFT_1903752 [Baffinella frigidus]|nr:hypothetical protein T484DRAFT_1903752 [Cryptophyta sp. CCMP2293]
MGSPAKLVVLELPHTSSTTAPPARPSATLHSAPPPALAVWEGRGLRSGAAKPIGAICAKTAHGRVGWADGPAAGAEGPASGVDGPASGPCAASAASGASGALGKRKEVGGGGAGAGGAGAGGKRRGLGALSANRLNIAMGDGSIY